MGSVRASVLVRGRAVRVVVLEPDKAPEVRELAEENTLKQLQDIVGGWIEVACTVPILDVVIYCNEEGLMLHLPFNCNRPSDGHPLVGTLVAVQLDPLTGNDVSMSEDQAKRVSGILLMMRLGAEQVTLH